jgi:hypothetical protein
MMLMTALKVKPLRLFDAFAPPTQVLEVGAQFGNGFWHVEF